MNTFWLKIVGIAVAVADILLNRARNILKSGVSPNEFIKGAVLAMEAGELLCGLSPTMSFEALRLQNTLECLFETGFPGCSYHNEAESRISYYENKEIQQKPNHSEYSG